jgi:hypothetical protein
MIWLLLWLRYVIGSLCRYMQWDSDDCLKTPGMVQAKWLGMITNQSMVAMVGSPCGAVNRLLYSKDAAPPTNTFFPITVPSMSGSARESDLSSFANFPLFTRLGLPTTNETQAILSIVETFGWTRVGVVYANTAIGNDMLKQLLPQAPLYGVRCEVVLPFNVSQLASVASVADTVIQPLIVCVPQSLI